MATQLSNKFKFLLLQKVLDMDSDTIKIALVTSSFTWSRATIHGYADVTNELSTANGYTAGGATLAGAAYTEDDTNNLGKVTYTNATWTASGTGIVAAGAVIYDDTVAAPTAKPVIGYIDFGGTQTTPAGGVFTVANIIITIA